MEKTIVATGKTIDLAIESALTQLGLDRDSVSVQVLQQAKAGFLGLGAQPAKVEVTYEAPDPVVVPEKPKSALGSASRSKPKAKPVPEKKPEAPKAEPAPKAEKKAEAPKAPKAPKENKEPKEAKPSRVYTPAAAGSTEEKIEIFVKGLLEHMGSKAVPQAYKENDNTYFVELVGEDLGYLDRKSVV